MYRYSLIILLAIASLSGIYDLNGQQAVHFPTVDSLTYQQYLAGDWKGLRKTAKHSIDNGLDYYYLRMRIAWSYYTQGKYRLATRHYEEALAFNSQDPVALNLLLNSYEFGGRKNDAIKASSKINYKNNLAVYQRYAQQVTDFSFFITYGNASSANAISAIINDFSPEQDGLQKAMKSYFFPQVGLTHKLGGNSILAEHRVGYMRKSEFSLFHDNQESQINTDQKANLLEYMLALHITPVYGFRISPGLIVSHTNIPIYSTEFSGFGRNGYSTIGYYNETHFLSFLKVEKDFAWLTPGFSAATGYVNLARAAQAGMHLTFFPFANLNLYYTASGYYQQQENGTTKLESYIHQHKVGFKLSRSLWLEAETIVGDLSNWYDINNNILYNALETTTNPVIVRAIIPIPAKNLQLVGSFSYTNSSSGYRTDAEPLQFENQQNYSTINFSGGLIWKL